jgi:hypothetical protein
MRQSTRYIHTVYKLTDAQGKCNAYLPLEIQLVGSFMWEMFPNPSLLLIPELISLPRDVADVLANNNSCDKSIKPSSLSWESLEKTQRACWE